MSSTATATSSSETKTVYILALADDTYYVGATNQLARRLRQHRDGHGAKWTQRHEVVELAAFNANLSRWQAVEKETTLRMMAAYGWRNVRGGPWTQRDLSSPPAALDQ
ncbi:GIY-YIG nuclease family protein [Halorubellus litoreus]|uniref:GIY-YIG nuclease family protein n=1 Tax=Halorubellus litoreus TaxID=755308 RepID=A0ABD5VHI0_9EURY